MQGLRGLGAFAVPCLVLLLCVPAASPGAERGKARSAWKMGKPIVTYWAGPAMTDATAKQMADGGWNLVWCGEKELGIVRKHGLRAQLQDGLLTPASLDDPARKAQLDALIARVKKNPALYSYFITDEPSASAFEGLGKLVAYLRERDPAHLAYINLFPTYANNEQLGTKGDVVPAYKEYLRLFMETVRPDLVSYDHYHFQANGCDGDQYFLNLGMIRQTALDAGVSFLNIVQACSWTPSMRVPNGDELRWLVYTSLAYGAQGISYYVYCHPNHNGAMANADGTTTPLYDTAKVVNREFAAIAAQLQPLRSLGAYHAGAHPWGTEVLPANAPFHLDPPLTTRECIPSLPVTGMVVGLFGKPKGQPTHAVVVNLNYKQPATTAVVGPGRLEVFNAATGKWSAAKGNRAELNLPPGGGALVRVRR